MEECLKRTSPVPCWRSLCSLVPRAHPPRIVGKDAVLEVLDSCRRSHITLTLELCVVRGVPYICLPAARIFSVCVLHTLRQSSDQMFRECEFSSSQGLWPGSLLSSGPLSHKCCNCAAPLLVTSSFFSLVTVLFIACDLGLSRATHARTHALLRPRIYVLTRAPMRRHVRTHTAHPLLHGTHEICTHACAHAMQTRMCATEGAECWPAARVQVSHVTCAAGLRAPRCWLAHPTLLVCACSPPPPRHPCWSVPYPGCRCIPPPAPRSK